MKELTFEQMENTQGGKFIGTVMECTTVMGTPVCTCHFDFFWLRFSDYYACGPGVTN